MQLLLGEAMEHDYGGLLLRWRRMREEEGEEAGQGGVGGIRGSCIPHLAVAAGSKFARLSYFLSTPFMAFKKTGEKLGDCTVHPRESNHLLAVGSAVAAADSHNAVHIL